MALSSLLRPLVGSWQALLFLLPPCAEGCVDCPCCLASSAATRLWMHIRVSLNMTKLPFDKVTSLLNTITH